MASVREKRRNYRWGGIALLALIALLYTHDYITQSGLEAARFSVIQAIGEQNRFEVEGTMFPFPDCVMYNGHAYSDKPLPLGWSAGMLHRIAHNWFGLSFAANYNLCIYLWSLLWAGVVNILLFDWTFRMLCRRKGRIELKFLLALAMTLGTWLFSYSVMLNNHTPAALAALGLYVILDKFRRRPSPAGAAAAGLAAGVAGCFDMPAGMLLGGAAVVAVFLASPREKQLRAASFCIGGGALIGLGMAALNFYAYGTVVPLYVAGGGGSYQVPVSDWTIDYLWHCWFGERGLFSYQPFLLLIFPAVYMMRRKLNCCDWSMLGASAAIMLFYVFFSNEYGGWAYGFRYLIVVIPVVWLFCCRWVLSWRWNWGRGVLVAVLLLWGWCAALVGAYAPYCVAYERVKTSKEDCSNVIRSTFMSNFLTWSYEHDPDSFVTRALFRHYGEKPAAEMVVLSAKNMLNMELLKRVENDPRCAAAVNWKGKQ